MRHRSTPLFALVLLLLLCACGGGGGSKVSPANPTLTQITDQDNGVLLLTLASGSGPADSYDIQVNVRGGNYVQINSEPIPASATAVLVTFDLSLNENSQLGFRIRAVASGTLGAWSADLQHLAPVYHPTTVQAYWDYNHDAVQVSWTSTSWVADGFRVERAEADPLTALPGAWTAVSGNQPKGTLWYDSEAVEGKTYVYRAVNLLGSAASLPSPASRTMATPDLLAPAKVQLLRVNGGFRLTWRNRSLSATAIQVERRPGGYTNPLGTRGLLPATATSFDDPNLPLGYYTYIVRVTRPENREAESAAVSAALANPPGALALTGEAMALPYYRSATLVPTGGWALLTYIPEGLLALDKHWPAWSPTEPAYYPWITLRFDPQGHPHILYVRDRPGGEKLLVHAWHDGVAWQSEDMVTLPMESFTFQVDRAGLPHCVVNMPAVSPAYGKSSQTLRYVHKAGAAWVVERLAAVPPQTSGDIYRLILDAAGAPTVLLGTYDGTLVAYGRTGEGVWPATVLPTGPVRSNFYDFAEGLAQDPDHAWIFYERDLPGPDAEYALMVLQKVDGVWQPPVTLGTRQHDGSSTRALSALSWEGNRVALLYGTTLGWFVHHTAPGGWTKTLVAPEYSGRSAWALGFDQANHLHVFMDGYPDQPTDYHE